MAEGEEVGGGLEEADVGFDAQEEDLAGRLGLWLGLLGSGEVVLLLLLLLLVLPGRGVLGRGEGLGLLQEAGRDFGNHLFWL